MGRICSEAFIGVSDQDLSLVDCTVSISLSDSPLSACAADGNVRPILKETGASVQSMKFIWHPLTKSQIDAMEDKSVCHFKRW